MLKKISPALIIAKELLPKRESMIFYLSLNCLLEMNLLIKIFNLSRILNFSRFSTAILKILQSIKIITLWRTYLTVLRVVRQAQLTQREMCQHEEISILT